jgi:hypothetical protein
MARLADIADLNAALDEEFGETDEKKLRLLELASGVVQREARQSFVRKDNDSQVLWLGTGSRSIWLPERPVLAVDSVSIHEPNAAPYPTSVFRWYPWGEIRYSVGFWPEAVTVVYDHGYDVIPADVRMVTCGVVSRILDNVERNVQDAIDAFAQSHGSAEWLTAEDKRILSTYRPKVFSVPIKTVGQRVPWDYGVVGNAG